MSSLSEVKKNSFWDHLAIIVKWRRFFLGYLTVMLIAAITYSLLATQWFESKAKLLPPPSDSFGLSSLLPGLGSSAMGLAGMLSDESNLLLTVLNSRALSDAVIDHFDWMKVHEFGSRSKAYKRFTKIFEWEAIEDGSIMLIIIEEEPQLAANTVNFIVDFVTEKYNDISTTQAKGQREFIEKRLNQNYKDIDTAENELQKFQRETGVIAFEEQVTASFGELADIHKELVLTETQLSVFRETLPENSAEVLAAKRNSSALRKQIERLNRRSDDEASSFFIGTKYAPEVGVKYMRLVRELEMQAVILQFVLPQYEQARISELRDEANVYVLDKGQKPDKKKYPKRAFVVVAWMFLSFFVAYLFIYTAEWVSELKDVNRAHYNKILYVIQHLSPKSFFTKD